MITHYHTDHWGGVLQLSRMIPIRRCYDHGPMESLSEHKEYPSYLADYEQACRGQRTTIRAGDRLPLRSAGKPPVEMPTSRPELASAARRRRVGGSATGINLSPKT